MEHSQTPFPAFWYGINLPGHREIEGCTYKLFPFSEVPPLSQERFREFQWLPAKASNLAADGGDSEDHEVWHAKFERLITSANQLGLSLPAVFLRFMRGELGERVAYNSYYRLPDRIVKSPKGDGYLFLFLAESQDCLLWYLYLDPASSDHCVVVSWDFFGCDIDTQPQHPEESDNIYFTANTFEEFIYRTWIANEFAIACHEGRWPPTPDQEQYLAYYRNPGDKSDRQPRCELHGCHLLPGHQLRLAPPRGWFPSKFPARHGEEKRNFPMANV